MASALKSVKICLHDCTSQEWPAGGAVLEAIVHALRQLGTDRPHICLSTWSNKSRESWKSLASFVDSIIELPAGMDNPSLMDSTLIGNHVDCFFSIPTSTAMTVSIPQICWIYDFQHLHHPRNFSPGESAKRSTLFRSNAEKANLVFVYSSAVERDFVAFAPDLASRIRRIRLVPHIPDKAWILDRKALQEYKLPAQFFFLPNQLQPHKNHERALAALRILSDRDGAIPVVCTGAIPERDLPKRDALIKRASELGVRHLLRILGYVPPPSYFQLLRQSVGLINPSLFEGFGMSVCEAGYLARQIVVSNIPVFHEHEIPNALYFNPDDPNDMAKRMKEAMARSKEVGGVERDAALAERHAAKQRRFGLEFIHMIEEAIRGPS
jgi:glycosyltransferase involved in cell wall biosynthesis